MPSLSRSVTITRSDPNEDQDGDGARRPGGRELEAFSAAQLNRCVPLRAGAAAEPSPAFVWELPGQEWRAPPQLALSLLRQRASPGPAEQASASAAEVGAPAPRQRRRGPQAPRGDPRAARPAGGQGRRSAHGDQEHL